MPVSWEAVGLTVLPNLGGVLSEIITRNEETRNWYKTIKKPSWAPANSLPVWPILYSGMGYSSYLIYRDCGGFQGDGKLPLTLYASQLALNCAWAPIFFGSRSLKWGAVDIVILTGTVAATTVAFHKINPVAAYLMIPYLAAVSMASLLNIKFYLLNKDEESEEPKKK